MHTGEEIKSQKQKAHKSPYKMQQFIKYHKMICFAIFGPTLY